MEINTHIVRFDEWCKKCKHCKTDEIDEPCIECLDYGGNENTTQPVMFEEKE